MSAKKRRSTAASAPTPRPAPEAGVGSPRIDWILTAILGAALFARVGVLLALHDHPLLQPRPGLDSAAYLDLARRVAGGDLLLGDRVFFLSPFYIYFTAGVLAISGGSILAVQLAQAILGTAAAWFAARTARLWFGARGAWVAAALAGGTGYFAFQESRLLQSAVDPFLTAFGLWAAARAWIEPRPRRFLLAGIVLGLHVLNRPNIALWALAVVVLTAGSGPRRRQAAATAEDAAAAGAVSPAFPSHPALVGAAALAVGLMIAVAPVAVRNWVAAGDLALVSSHGGLNFYVGNNPRADGTYRPVEGITPSIEGQARDMRQVAERATGRPHTDTEASSWFRGEALKWIGRNPGQAVWLFVKKIAYVFNAADIPLNDSYTYYATDETSPLRLLAVGPWLLLPLGLAGAWFGRPRGLAAAWWRWVAFVPVYALAVAVFFVTGRYRLPLLVACSVTAAGCLLWLFDRARARRWRDLGPAVAVVAVLGLATNADLGLDDGVGAWRAEMILHHIEAGRDAQAEELLARAEASYPNRALLLYRAGRAWLARGDAGRALPVLDRARAAAPDRRDIDLEVGQALLALGRAGEAAERLRAALDVAGREDEARLALSQALAMTGEPAEAAAALSSLQAPERLPVDSQILAGRLALGLERADLAEPFLARAVKGAPRKPEVGEAYGLALATLGRRNEAIAALEEATRLDPGNAGVRMNLAILYAGAGRFGDARRLANEALRLGPDDPRAREFLASLPPGR